KNGTSLYFTGDSLMYGAIFSDKEIYECQVKRLMKRTKALSEIYSEKRILVSLEGCNSDTDSELSILASMASNLQSSQDLIQIERISEDLSRKNEGRCPLW